MKRTLRYNLVDVFTDTPLTGNPLAVFTKGLGLSTETMQAIAREMNLSETVFFFPPTEGGHVKLRIFTPLRELPFAGHPVLGSAWVLGHPMEMGALGIETQAGIIPVELHREGGQLYLARMSQPLPIFEPCTFAIELLRALGLPEPAPPSLAPMNADNGPSHVIVEAPTRHTVDTLTPDLRAVAQLTTAGVLVFAQEGDTCHARYFAPAAGISEDPATGSAAGPLAALLVQKGRHSSGANLTIHQGVTMNRPSLLLAEATLEEGTITRVQVAGSAVVLAKGELLLR
jgi:trans-2,3-dihydro-3-hydroxyanthranilate isomerase